MITGVVTAFRQTVIHLAVRGSDGQEQKIEAAIDMGFDGTCTGIVVLIATHSLV